MRTARRPPQPPHTHAPTHSLPPSPLATSGRRRARRRDRGAGRAEGAAAGGTRAGGRRQEEEGEEVGGNLFRDLGAISSAPFHASSKKTRELSARANRWSTASPNWYSWPARAPATPTSSRPSSRRASRDEPRRLGLACPSTPLLTPVRLLADPHEKQTLCSPAPSPPRSHRAPPAHALLGAVFNAAAAAADAVPPEAAQPHSGVLVTGIAIYLVTMALLTAWDEWAVPALVKRGILPNMPGSLSDIRRRKEEIFGTPWVTPLTANSEPRGPRTTEHTNNGPPSPSPARSAHREAGRGPPSRSGRHAAALTPVAHEESLPRRQGQRRGPVHPRARDRRVGGGQEEQDHPDGERRRQRRLDPRPYAARGLSNFRRLPFRAWPCPFLALPCPGLLFDRTIPCPYTGAEEDATISDELGVCRLSPDWTAHYGHRVYICKRKE